MKKKICFVIIISMLITFCLPSASLAADSFSLTDKLTAFDGTAGEYYGYSVAISGDTAVVGAYMDSDNGANSGSVYIYNLHTGATSKITAFDGAAGDAFGYSVAISGDIVVVGAIGDDDNGETSGAIYVYDLSDRAKDQKITAVNGAAQDYFGCSVAISGNLVAVGAHGVDDNGANSGAVYVYDLSDGNRETKLTASDGAAGDLFGISVDISGSKAAVGAKCDNDNGSWSGSAYIYDLADSNRQTKLTASDGAQGDEFGYSVAISEDTLVVGASNDDDMGSDSGSVYLYDLSDTNSETKLTPSGGESGDHFGASVAISGDNFLVGASGDDDVNTAAGAVYMYDLSDTNSVTKLTASDGLRNDYLGTSVAISGENIVAGAFLGDGNAADSGSAYYIYAPESSVALNNLGGSGETSIIAAYGRAMPSGVAAPTRVGYSFAGYYRNLSEESSKYYNADMTSAQNWDRIGSTTLYAKWEPTPITIDTDALSEATVGENYSFTVTASGGVGSCTWYATGLPYGLSIAADTGIISGKTNESGDFAVNIKVYDSIGKNTNKDFTLKVNSQPMTGKYTISPSADVTYTISTVEGFTTLTINSGVSGFKYIKVSVASTIAHEGEETVVFVQLRNGAQIGFSSSMADFDMINTAIAGFNVQQGDIIKIYVVDRLSNDPSVNPVLLQ